MKGAIDFVRRHRVGAVIGFLLVFPLLMPYEALAINILVFGLFAVGFNLLFGYTGLLSFGHAAFLGVGSYVTGIAMVHGALPWGLALVLGVAGATLVGVVMGFLAIRTRGIYFSMVTLALAQIVYYAFYKAEHWTGGENGLRGIQDRARMIARAAGYVYLVCRWEEKYLPIKETRRKTVPIMDDMGTPSHGRKGRRSRDRKQRDRSLQL